MTPEALKARTKKFALRILAFAETLPRRKAVQHIGGQMVRAGTSVGANYRAACRAQSRATFIAKLAIVEEEADETQYWLELLDEWGAVPAEHVNDLLGEAGELVAIFTASRKTATRPRRP